MSDIAGFIAVGVAVLVAILLLAAFVKLREVRRARTWPSIPGKVVISKIESRERGGVRSNDAQRSGNYPKIVYEFEVAGEIQHGERVSIGEAMPGVDVESTLARYPVGTAVQVFYDPKDPTQSVLERDLPPGFAKILAALVVFFILAAAVAILLTTGLASALSAGAADPDKANLALFLGGLGAFVGLIAFVQSRQLAQTKAWPSVRGEVRSAVVERYLSDRSTDTHRSSVLYRPRIVYAYSVGGREYTSDRIALGAVGGSAVSGLLRSTASKGENPRGEIDIVDKTGGRITGGVPSRGVENVVRRYPAGSTVDVYYDPANPSQALLERRVAGGWIVWTISGALVAGGIVALVRR
jgi:hypothetical protein